MFGSRATGMRCVCLGVSVIAALGSGTGERRVGPAEDALTPRARAGGVEAEPLTEWFAHGEPTLEMARALERFAREADLAGVGAAARAWDLLTAARVLIERDGPWLVRRQALFTLQDLAAEPRCPPAVRRAALATARAHRPPTADERARGGVADVGEDPPIGLRPPPLGPLR